MKTEIFTRSIVRVDGDYFTLDEHAEDSFGMTGRVKVGLTDHWRTREQMVEYLVDIVDKLIHNAK